jgi:glycosyltransferase involved in cell wall biosynthesis
MNYAENKTKDIAVTDFHDSELVNFLGNPDSISKQENIESVLLYGNPDAVTDAKITICIPTYKRKNLLRESLESAVGQNTGIPYRIIVVDNDSDFSNMEVLEIVKLFPEKIIAYYKNREGLGMNGNWNRCAVLAKTKYIGFLHDDDLLSDNYITELSRILKNDKIKGLSVSMKMDKPIISPMQNALTARYPFVKKIWRFIDSLTGEVVRGSLVGGISQRRL